MAGPRRMVGVSLAICVTALMGLAAVATATTGLIGEVFVGGASYQTASCSNAEPTTFTFTASGTAYGPYAGTFSEAGSFTIRPLPELPGHGIITAFSATFRIASGTGMVEGEKTLDEPHEVSYFCSPERYQVNLGGTVVRYDATIDGAGPTRDIGYATLLIANPPELAFLNTQFVTEPKATDTCKDGGYAELGFATQGECIQYIKGR